MRCLAAWRRAALSVGTGGAGWQQFVMHVKDDHGDGVADYNVQLFVGDDLKQSDDPGYPPLPLIVDSYSGDSSYRCFYVRLSEDMIQVGTDGHPKKVWMELIASSGTSYLEYEAYNNLNSEDPNATASAARLTTTRRRTLDARRAANSGAPSVEPLSTTTISAAGAVWASSEAKSRSSSLRPFHTGMMALRLMFPTFSPPPPSLPLEGRLILWEK